MSKLGVLLVAALVSLAFGVRVLAGQDNNVGYSGLDDFRSFCASCPGPLAKGDGVLAGSFKKRPPDLTQLAKRNDGTFPVEQVFKTIDGREPVKGHGGKDMPVWGEVFAQSRDSQGPDGVKARIESLVRYLEKIQEKE